jgi:hypothetical protein
VEVVAAPVADVPRPATAARKTEPAFADSTVAEHRHALGVHQGVELGVVDQRHRGGRLPRTSRAKGTSPACVCSSRAALAATGHASTTHFLGRTYRLEPQEKIRTPLHRPHGPPPIPFWVHHRRLVGSEDAGVEDAGAGGGDGA